MQGIKYYYGINYYDKKSGFTNCYGRLLVIRKLQKIAKYRIHENAKQQGPLAKIIK